MHNLELIDSTQSPSVKAYSHKAKAIVKCVIFCSTFFTFPSVFVRSEWMLTLTVSAFGLIKKAVSIPFTFLLSYKHVDDPSTCFLSDVPYEH